MKRRVVSAAEMRELDRRATQDFGISALALMEKAGEAVARAAARFPSRGIVVCCGAGNNGGDGLAAARLLKGRGRKVRVVLAASPLRFHGQALVQWKALRPLSVPVNLFQAAQKVLQWDAQTVVVDALLGTGAHLPLRALHQSFVRWINRAPGPVVSVDVPTGLDPDDGRPKPVAVRSDVTVSLGWAKKGLVLDRARPYVGRLVVADIGFPKTIWGGKT